MPFLWKRSASNSKSDSHEVSEIQPLRADGPLTTTLTADIYQACKRTDIGLWDAYARSVGGQPISSGAGRLVFPRYRDKGLRVSEQEARFAFVEAISRGPLSYSVEAPTSKLYSFSGKTPMSAQTDLQLHGESETCICNVEFKASLQNRKVYQDMQKLLREPRWGLWFHLRETMNNATTKNVFGAVVDQIGKVQSNFGGDIESPGLTLHMCVLRHGFSLQKDVSFPPDGRININELNEHLSVYLKVSRSELIKVYDLNGWDLHRRPVGSAG